MPASWCDVNDVNEHLGDAQNAKGYADADVAEKIMGAEDYLRPYFSSAVTSTIVATWLSKTTTPRAVIRLTAMLAAVYILQSFGGQSVQDEVSKAGSLWSQIQGVIKGIQNGTYLLVDAAGAPVNTELPWSSTQNKTPTFSMGNDGDSSDGTLDNL